jgi:hypothetical protein
LDRPPRCLICNNAALRSYVDDALDKGITMVGIAASIEALGGKLDPDVIGRHKNNGHWVKKVKTEHTPTARDLNIMVRDKVVEAIEDIPGEGLLLMGKEFGPALNAGLKAQAALDKKAATQAKLGLEAGALSLQLHLAGLRDLPPPPELEDGNTIEGEAHEVA